jgi:hypothetical protein
MTTTKKNDSELIIDQLGANTTELLKDYLKRAETLALGTDEIKVAILHSITTGTGKMKAKSTITFGRRIKASVEHEIDPDQIEMDLGKAAKRRPKVLARGDVTHMLTDGAETND